MQFKARLVPKSGEKDEQAFCMSLQEAIKWGRRTLWDRHRKLVQQTEKGEVSRELTGPRISIVEYKAEQVFVVYPWDVTDEDKKQESGE